jgi:hypothetical protein
MCYLFPELIFVNVYGAQESIPRNRFPPAYVAWRAGTANKIVVPARRLGIDSWAPLNVLQIRAHSACSLNWYSLRWPESYIPIMIFSHGDKIDNTHPFLPYHLIETSLTVVQFCSIYGGCSVETTNKYKYMYTLSNLFLF